MTKSYPRFTNDVLFPGDTPAEEVVRTIDPELAYLSEGKGGSSRRTYVVRDGGKKRLLKVCNNAYRVNDFYGEHQLMINLNKAGARGIPQVFRVYPDNFCPRGDVLDRPNYHASLVEFIDGENFDDKLIINPLTYASVVQLVRDLHKQGVGLPPDFFKNLVVNISGRAFLVDLEEYTFADVKDYATATAGLLSENLRLAGLRLEDRIKALLGRKVA